jgi:formyl-CoA transferase
MTVPEVLSHPQVANRGIIARFDDIAGLDRSIEVLRTGVKINGMAPAVTTPPPALGIDNSTVWREIGVTEDELMQLQQEGVI